MVIKEKKELWGIKQMDKMYELRQLPICSTQLLEYNHMRNNIKSICNVYLQHHPIRVNIWGCPNIMQHHLTISLNYNPKLVGGQVGWKCITKMEALVMFTNWSKTSPTIIGQMPLEGLAKANSLATPRVLIIFQRICPTST